MSAKLSAVPLSRYNDPSLVDTAGAGLLTSPNALSYKYDSIDEAFPDVAPGIKPLGAKLLVQIRQPKRYSSGGIALPSETRSTEHYNTQIAKVIALGPLCFKTVKEIPAAVGETPRDVLVDFVEGRWFEVGQFVRVPKYGGDRFAVDYDHVYRVKEPGSDHFENKTEKEEIIFVLLQSKDVIGVVTGDPLKMKAFLD